MARILGLVLLSIAIVFLSTLFLILMDRLLEWKEKPPDKDFVKPRIKIF